MIQRRRAYFEILEPRHLLATVTINAGTTIRSVDTQWLGINTSITNYRISSTGTGTMTTALGTPSMRLEWVIY